MKVQQSKKRFYDWLDKSRPWARLENQNNVYNMMETIVNRAALYFANEPDPADLKRENNRLNDDIVKITSMLKSHPKGYEGPCACPDCLVE